MDTRITQTVQEQQTISLRIILGAMEALRHHTKAKDWTLAQLLVLTTVGIKGEVAQSELADVTQVSGSAVSRILYEQIGPNGLNLVSIRPDPENRSRQIVGLTKAGKEAVAAMVLPIQRRLYDGHKAAVKS